MGSAACRFFGGPHAPAQVCSCVWTDGVPIHCVSRTPDGWYFLCGNDHAGRRARFRAVTVGDVVARDASLALLATLNEHHIAWRKSKDDPWRVMDEEPEWVERQSIYWWP